MELDQRGLQPRSVMDRRVLPYLNPLERLNCISTQYKGAT